MGWGRVMMIMMTIMRSMIMMTMTMMKMGMAMTMLILFPPHWPITTNANMRWGTSAAKLVGWRPGYLRTYVLVRYSLRVSQTTLLTSKLVWLDRALPHT